MAASLSFMACFPHSPCHWGCNAGSCTGRWHATPSTGPCSPPQWLLRMVILLMLSPWFTADKAALMPEHSRNVRSYYSKA